MWWQLIASFIYYLYYYFYRTKIKILTSFSWLIRLSSQIFNKEIFGNIFKRKRTIEARMRGIQRSFERVDSLFLFQLEQTLQHEYNHILFQEELFWFQKSREEWVKLGDKNTSYFHAQTVIRRKRNKVHGLNLPNGIWCSDEEVLQQEAQLYFQNLFCINHNV